MTKEKSVMCIHSSCNLIDKKITHRDKALIKHIKNPMNDYMIVISGYRYE